jgi:hypothetical protein
MSDPRYTDPRMRPDPDPSGRRPMETDPMRGSGQTWGWVAAIVALAVVIALVFGYYHNEPSTASRTQPSPTTTGAAPAAPRPMSPNAVPAGPQPAAPAPAAPAAPVPGEPPKP